MKEIRNSQVAKEFNEVADLMEIKGANPFRVRAYRNAARVIENFSKPIMDLIKSGEALEEYAGIGKDLAQKIVYTAKEGIFPEKSKIEEGLPKGILSLLKIPSLGPKRAALLYKKLKVSSLEELERSCREELVREIRGFGEKTEKRLLDEIGKLKGASHERKKLADAEGIAKSIVPFLEKLPGVDKVVVAGSFRRRRETVADLDILVTCRKKNSKLTEQVVSYPGAKTVLSCGTTRATFLVEDDFQVDVRVVAKESFGAALCYFTGSKNHSIAIRGLALKRKLKINEYGVFRGKTRVAGLTEEEVYGCLKLPYIPPELRENTGEIEAAAENKLPKLIELKDIKGDLHSHTLETDGMSELGEMAVTAKKLGYEYLAITDHTKALAFANGLDEKRLGRQFEEIDKFNEKLKPFKILKSAEVDILEDGRLDISNSHLKKFDVVLIAVHSYLNLSKQKQTTRILRALDNPYANILAHPFCRLIHEREPIDMDFERIAKHMKESGRALEINSQPSRLDLPDYFCKAAKAMGLKFVISTDSHHTSQLKNMRYGVDVARRGWLEKPDIINTQSLKQLLTTFGRRD